MVQRTCYRNDEEILEARERQVVIVVVVGRDKDERERATERKSETCVT